MAGTQAKRSSIEYATGRVGPRTAGKTRARVRRHLRVRKKVAGSTARPRLVVNRSARHIVAQIVDDTFGRTLASASTLDPTIRTAEGDKTAKAKLVGELLKRVFTAGPFARAGYILARGGLNRLREWLDPRRYNGAVLLGLNGVVVKSHGGTDAMGFAHAVDVALDMISNDFNRRIAEGLAAMDSALLSAVPETNSHD